MLLTPNRGELVPRAGLITQPRVQGHKIGRGRRVESVPKGKLGVGRSYLRAEGLAEVNASSVNWATAKGRLS